MNARAQIFAAISTALNDLPHRTPRPLVQHGAVDARWLTGGSDDVALFSERAIAVGTTVFVSAGDFSSWLLGQRDARVYVPDSLRDLVAGIDGSVEVVHEYSRGQIDGIDIAVTPAAGAVAESGTIILTDESTPDRLAALAPWTHIAVVRRDTIHRSIADALAGMPDDPNIIWVTGPSKTADVEGILIQGVHGPGVQGCLLL